MSIIPGRSNHRPEVDEFEPGPGRARTYEEHLRATYGLSPEDYGAMVERQGGCCAICRRHVELHVDHDHETGLVRGLLCRRCNLGIGYFLDDPELLLLVVDYLRVARYESHT